MSADIKVGDLIKATHSEDPEVTITGRVNDLSDYWLWTTRHTFTRNSGWDFEVLERPVPPVEEELLKEAYAAYVGNILGGKDARFAAVINAVREFDNRSKENSK